MKLRIKEIRQRLGLTQQELAEMAGLSVSYLSEIENNKKTINGNRLETISKALKVSPTELIEENTIAPALLDHLQNLKALTEEDRLMVLQLARSLAVGK